MGLGDSRYQAHGFHESLPKGKASGELVVTSSGISFTSGDRRVTLPLHGIQFRLGGASDRLVFASHPSVPDWSLYTSDLTILRDPHLSDVPSIKAQLNKARNRRLFNWSVLVACVVLVVAIPLMLLTRMDWVSAVIAEQIPAEWEQSLGESTFAQLQIGKRVMTDEAGEAALRDLTEPLLAAVESDRYEFNIVVTDDPAVNAFALPGGFIVINAGLIREADNAGEVLGVLAHEIAHVTEQHGMRNIINAAGVFLLVDALLGDVSGILAMLANAAPLLINQSYSRKFEAEADERGLALLEQANIDPSGFVSFFEKMLAREKEQLATIEDEDTRTLVEDAMGFLSTHPATEDRIREITELSKDIEGPFTSYQSEFLQLREQVNLFMSRHHKEAL